MKANEFDKKVKNHVKQVEHATPKHVKWDIDRSWDKISQLLKQASPKSIIWYFSLAASVSMVMASTQLIKDIFEPVETDIEVGQDNTNTEVASYSDTPTSRPDPIKSLMYLEPVAARKIAYTLVEPSDLHKIDIKTVSLSSSTPTSHKQIHVKPRFSTSASTRGFFAGAELRVLSNQSIRNTRLGFGLEAIADLSSFANQEENNSKLPATNALYASLLLVNDKSKRSWNASIGTPVIQSVTDDNKLKPMLKLNYQTKLTPWLYIGPEVIITRQFKKIYPGITLSFG